MLLVRTVCQSLTFIAYTVFKGMGVFLGGDSKILKGT